MDNTLGIDDKVEAQLVECDSEPPPVLKVVVVEVIPCEDAKGLTE